MSPATVTVKLIGSCRKPTTWEGVMVMVEVVMVMVMVMVMVKVVMVVMVVMVMMVMITRKDVRDVGLLNI